MENASKSLLIAGTVLIAIIMVSIAVYLYTLFSAQTKEYNATISAIEIEKFNSNFDVYVGRKDITAQELVSIVNLAKEYDYQIQIYLNGGKLVLSNTAGNEHFIKKNRGNFYSCTLNTVQGSANPEYDQEGKITKLKFFGTHVK